MLLEAVELSSLARLPELMLRFAGMAIRNSLPSELPLCTASQMLWPISAAWERLSDHLAVIRHCWLCSSSGFKFSFLSLSFDSHLLISKVSSRLSS
jgi:hypothetical protein